MMPRRYIAESHKIFSSENPLWPFGPPPPQGGGKSGTAFPSPARGGCRAKRGGWGKL